MISLLSQSYLSLIVLLPSSIPSSLLLSSTDSRWLIIFHLYSSQLIDTSLLFPFLSSSRITPSINNLFLCFFRGRNLSLQSIPPIILSIPSLISLFLLFLCLSQSYSHISPFIIFTASWMERKWWYSEWDGGREGKGRREREEEGGIDMTNGLVKREILNRLRYHSIPSSEAKEKRVVERVEEEGGGGGGYGSPFTRWPYFRIHLLSERKKVMVEGSEGIHSNRRVIVSDALIALQVL